MKIKVKDLILIVFLIIVVIGVAIYFATHSNKTGGGLLGIFGDGENVDEDGSGSNSNAVEQEFTFGKLRYKVFSDFEEGTTESGSKTYTKTDISNDGVTVYTFLVQVTEYSEGAEEDIMAKLKEDNYGIDKDCVIDSTVLHEERISGYPWQVVKIKYQPKDIGEDITLYSENYYGFKDGKFYILLFKASKKGVNQSLSIEPMKSILNSLDFNH